MKRSMPDGLDPKDGETARELADQQLGRLFWSSQALRHGWDDIVACPFVICISTEAKALKEAEKSFPRGLYKESELSSAECSSSEVRSEQQCEALAHRSTRRLSLAKDHVAFEAWTQSRRNVRGL